MMQRITILPLLVIFFSINRSFGQIDLSNLQASFRLFIDEVNLSKDTIPDKYFMTFEMFDSLCHQTFEKYDRVKVSNQYFSMKRNAKIHLSRLRLPSSSNISFSAIDTLSYVDDGSNQMKLFIDGENSIRFILYKRGAELYLSSNIRSQSRREFLGSVRYSMIEKYRGEFEALLINAPVTSSLLKVLPFTTKNLMGFKSLTSGEVILQSEFETIYPFRSGYWCVMRSTGYNLVDTSMRLIFKEDKKSIRVSDKIYLTNNKLIRNYYEYSDDGINYFQINSTILGDSTYKVSSSYSYDEIRAVTEDKILEKRIREHEANLRNEHYQISRQYYCIGSGNTVPYKSFVFNRDRDTILVLDNCGIAQLYGSVVICPIENRTEIRSLEGKLLLNTDFVISFMDNNACLEIFDPYSRKFGIYGVTQGIYIEPKYDYIEPIDNGAFYIALLNHELVYIDPKGVIQAF